MKKYLLAALMAAILEIEKKTDTLNFEWDGSEPNPNAGRSVGVVVVKPAEGLQSRITAAVGSQAHLKYDQKTGLFGLAKEVEAALLRRKIEDLEQREAALLAREKELAAREAALSATKAQAGRKKKAAEGEATEPAEAPEVEQEPTA